MHMFRRLKKSLCLVMVMLTVFGCFAFPVSSEEAVAASSAEAAPIPYTLTLPAEKTDDAAKLTDGNANTRVSIKADRKIGIAWEGEAKRMYIKLNADADKKFTLVQYDANGTELYRSYVSNSLYGRLFPIFSKAVYCELLPGNGENCTFGSAEDITDSRRASVEDGLVICDLYLYGSGKLPSDVYYFDYSTAPAEVMLIVARPGDEYLAFGGLLPLLADRNVDVQLVILEQQTPQQREDSLRSFSSLGFRRQPIVLDTVSKGGTDYSQLKKKGEWNCSAIIDTLAGLIGQYSPEILITYDSDRNIENGTHSLLGDLTDKAFKQMKKYGTSLPPVVYRLNETNESDAILPAFSAGLTATPDKSATDVANECLSSFSGRIARLNLTAAEECGFTAEYTIEEAGLTYEKSALVISFETPASAFASPATDAGATAAASETVPVEGEEDKWAAYFRREGEPEEVVVQDTENDHYEYRSDTLSVIIDGFNIEDPYNSVDWAKDFVNSEAEEVPWVYYVAHIRMRDNEFFEGFSNEKHNGGDPRQIPYKLARAENAVLYLTGDNIIHAEKEKKGILIRDGFVYSEADASDTLAFYPDMSLRVFKQGTVTAKQLLEDGVINSYGMMYYPILVQDGKIDADIEKSVIFGRNPRCAIGMVEPGHYVAIVTEGRKDDYKAGFLLSELAQLFINEGCTVAYNLDGGISASMVFMGEQLNTHRGGSKKDAKYQRNVPEGLCFGFSELVPSVNDPVRNTGNAAGVR